MQLEDVTKLLKGSAVGLVPLALFLMYWDWPGSRRSDMPPGPRPLPIIGNMLDLKPLHLYAQLHALHVKYGSIVSLKIGSGTLISLAGDGTHVKQLLDKRGPIYSARPFQVIHEISGSGDNVLFQQDLNRWRLARKQIVRHFAPSTMRDINFVVQESESVQLLYDFLHEPRSFMAHSMRYTASVLTCLAYGVRCDVSNSLVAQRVQKAMSFPSQIVLPGGKPPLVYFPWLNSIWLPDFLAPWKAQCREMGAISDKLYTELAEIGWQRGCAGLNTDNLAYKLRLNEDHNELTRHEQAFTCGVALEGGSDIVAGLLITSLMALVNDPQSQIRAQAEIDAIHGEETLPTWKDEQSLPFIRAIMKETLRWRPPLSLAVQHRLEQDDLYDGYFLPKDSTVLCNSWAIHHNPDRYDEPEKFKPERFIGDNMPMADSIAQGDPLKRDHFAFGAGRRVCPGIQTAEQDIFIALARLLWAFEFSAPPGVEIPTDHLTAFVGRNIRVPADFPLVIKVRSERRAQTIEREMIAARDVYAQYGLYK
ncbi:cytochrome P450 [Ceratobasidium sp. AG-I]|nr:cytochrome P450 [Ceratobasidium sp. AG-I]